MVGRQRHCDVLLRQRLAQGRGRLVIVPFHPRAAEDELLRAELDLAGLLVRIERELRAVASIHEPHVRAADDAVLRMSGPIDLHIVDAAEAQTRRRAVADLDIVDEPCADLIAHDVVVLHVVR